MGSRYGGLKQIDGMGPQGEWLLEYGIYDAVQAGFGKIVFVVGRSFAEVFEAEWERRCGGVIGMEMVFQEPGDVPEGSRIPEGRKKPLGTGHAIWSARRAIDGPFAVINADDFYGRDALESLSEALSRTSGGLEPHPFCMVAYSLKNTLSAHGRVSRGVCRLNAEGELERVREHTHIVPVDGVITSRHSDGHEEVLSGDTPVSMNLWGFTPDIFPRLEDALRHFVAGEAMDESKELFIPFVVDELIQKGLAKVTVYRTESAWFGVTYGEDKPQVRQALQRLHDVGFYPNPLWSSKI